MAENEFAKELRDSKVLKLNVVIADGKSPEIVFEGPWNGLMFGAAQRVIKKGWRKRKYDILRDHIKLRQDNAIADSTKKEGENNGS